MPELPGQEPLPPLSDEEIERLRDFALSAEKAHSGRWSAHRAQKGSFADWWMDAVDPEDPEETRPVCELLNMQYYCQLTAPTWKHNTVSVNDAVFDHLEAFQPETALRLLFDLAAAREQIKAEADAHVHNFKVLMRERDIAREEAQLATHQVGVLGDQLGKAEEELAAALKERDTYKALAESNLPTATEKLGEWVTELQTMERELAAARSEIERLSEGVKGAAQSYCSRCGWGDERRRDMWDVWAHVDPDNEWRTIPCDASALWELLEPAAHALVAPEGAGREEA